MESAGAIVFLPRDRAEDAPVLLEPLLFSPAATWLAQALLAAGAEQFLVVCHDADRDRAAPCFPDGTEFVTTGGEDAGARLSAFLSAHAGHVMVVTKPVLLAHGALRFLPAGQQRASGGEAGLYRISAQALADAMDSGLDFETALHQHGSPADQACTTLLSGGDPAQWRALQARAQQMEVARLEGMGARFIDPASCFSDPTVRVEKGTVILPNVILRGNTYIGSGCEIGPNSMIQDCVIGPRVTVNHSQLLESTVDADAKIGPFAYIRPHCHVGSGVKVGDFVELKNSVIGQGTKISHLTYVGDSDVGSGVNFGCGTVTVNYDGTAKFRTTVGDDAFIGCNTNLVAPVKIGPRAYTAAGSTVTQDVPADSLCVARSPQTIKVNWALKRRKAREKR